MKKNITKWLILLTVLSPLSLQAQGWLSGAPWTQSSPAVTMGADTNGTLVATAPINTSLTFNSTETGTTNPQLLWVPALGAFRAGSFYSAPSTTTMGEYSTALGFWCTASGIFSIAMGFNSTASAWGAVALGEASAATGLYSVALGAGSATGNYSAALGNGIAAGNYAAIMGQSTSATGNNSTAMGMGTSAASYCSTAVGAYDLGAAASTTTWIATDPLFEIGNGTSSSAKSDALVVYKNGNATFPTTTSTVTAATFVTTQSSGDIPMYTGN